MCHKARQTSNKSAKSGTKTFARFDDPVSSQRFNEWCGAVLTGATPGYPVPGRLVCVAKGEHLGGLIDWLIDLAGNPIGNSLDQPTTLLISLLKILSLFFFFSLLFP